MIIVYMYTALIICKNDETEKETEKTINL